MVKKLPEELRELAISLRKEGGWAYATMMGEHGARARFEQQSDQMLGRLAKSRPPSPST